jgi:hypothetical protein
MEKVWKGLAIYTGIHGDKSRIIMIQRGIEDPLKGHFRNFPVHKCAARVKKELDTKYSLIQATFAGRNYAIKLLTKHLKHCS